MVLATKLFWCVGVVFIVLSSCTMLDSTTFRNRLAVRDGRMPEQNIPRTTGDPPDSYSEDELAKQSMYYPKHLRSRQDYYLEQELGALVHQASPEDQALYQAYSNDLPSLSEKIYFLRLPSTYEKQAYLRSKGLMRGSTLDIYHQLTSQKRPVLRPGMTKEDILMTWGRPVRREVAGQARQENERWSFDTPEGTKYIYFENGRVSGWTNTPF